MAGYPAARTVAPSVAEQLAAHCRAAREHGVHAIAPVPGVEEIEAIVDTGFWASLQREEGRSPSISLAFISPGDAGQAMVFARALPLAPAVLSRLSPAVERPGIHLGVWPSDGALRVWGTTRSVPTPTLVLEVTEPGLLVLKYRRADELDRYGTIAVIEGDRVHVIDERGASLPDCPSLLASLQDFAPHVAGAPGVLVPLAVSMRAHRRGGLLAVVPAEGDGWTASAAHPIPYRVEPYRGLRALLDAGDDERARPAWREALQRTVDAVAGLTAVDGATVMNDRSEVLAFGVKLARRRGGDRVERVSVTAPVLGDEAAVVDPSRLGGTRHLSAAQFIHDQRDALALVASQDGRFTVFAWSPCEEMVHAHRIETLLM